MCQARPRQHGDPSARRWFCPQHCRANMSCFYTMVSGLWHVFLVEDGLQSPCNTCCRSQRTKAPWLYHVGCLEGMIDVWKCDWCSMNLGRSVTHFFLCHQGGAVDHANVADHLLAPAGVGFGPSVFWYSHVELAEPQWGHGLETDVAGNDLQQSAVAASGLFLQKILAVEQFPLSLWAISTLDCGIVSVIPVGTLYGLLILTFYVTSFLACTLTFYPTFDLGSILTNFLAYSVTLFLAL